ncbi:MAG: hypothetical protein ACOC5T_08650 [Elusimicrobiota bacterium]
MEQQIKYFIIPIVNATSACENGILMYHCRIVTNDYKEIFNLLLNEEDTKAFIEIMKSDKSALLYRTHNLLGEVAYWKMDHCHKNIIRDGIKYP